MDTSVTLATLTCVTAIITMITAILTHQKVNTVKEDTNSKMDKVLAAALEAGKLLATAEIKLRGGSTNAGP